MNNADLIAAIKKEFYRHSGCICHRCSLIDDIVQALETARPRATNKSPQWIPLPDAKYESGNPISDNVLVTPDWYVWARSREGQYYSYRLPALPVIK